jgi:DNA polymerase elongation subunit (family B)
MVSAEKIKEFLEGKDSEEYIVGIETYSSWTKDDSNDIYLIIDHPEKGKYIKKEQITPFCWVKNLSQTGFYNNDKDLLETAIKKYGIISKKLNTGGQKRLEEGHSHLVRTTGTYRDLINFFKKGGINPFKDRDKVLMLSPQEQYLIQTGKRLFKGIEDYTKVHKLIFDIETTSLQPKDGHIFLIGIKDNRGFQKILSSYDEMGYNEELEKDIIIKFFESISNLKPSIITGYNSENFDFPYIFGRAEILGLNINQIVKTRHPEVKLIRRESTLKLGGEMETYTQNLIWGYNVMDTYHSVRQAQAINSDIKEANLKYIAREAKVIRPNRVYIPGNLLGKMWMENKNFYYNPENGRWKEEFEEGWVEKSGRWLIEEYLISDLEETEKVDNIYRQSTFLIGKTIPTNFVRVATMGTAAMWNAIMQAYSYENDLSIPKKVETRQIVGGLSRLFRVGYNKNVIKIDYSSLYPSIQITHDVFPECDIKGVMKGLLQYFYDERTKYKTLMKKAKKEGNEEMVNFYDRKQLPIKILNNTMFGSLSAPNVFYWGDMDMGEMITCTGRQYLRLMIKYFENKGYKSIVTDTDGLDVALPEDINTHKYIGKGLHHMVEEGKEYSGYDADIAEFNEKYMYGVMGLSLDGVYLSSVNFARKNYADKKIDGKIKLVGNTIKSKTIPKYIEKFLDKGIDLLLDGRGSDFINHYYELIDKLYNKRVPLIEIANKSKVKCSLEEYLNRGTDKNGKDKASQAHMELVIKEGLNVNLGDVIYYVNNGTKKSHGDFSLKPLKDGTKEKVFNCYLIPQDDIEKQRENLIGEYNVAKYIDMLNKRIEPLMVCFHPDIRNKILINNPEERNYFTDEEMTLVSGIPMEEGDQDNLEKELIPEEREYDFWDKMGVNPEYMIKDRFEEKIEENILEN